MLRSGIERGKGPARLIAGRANLVDAVSYEEDTYLSLAPRKIYKGLRMQSTPSLAWLVVEGFRNIRHQALQVYGHRGFRIYELRVWELRNS